MIGRVASLVSGPVAGVVLGLGLGAAPIVVVGLFERKPPSLLLINGGLGLMGALLGAWK